MIALVRDVTAGPTASGFGARVAGSTPAATGGGPAAATPWGRAQGGPGWRAAKPGRAPARTITLAVAGQVSGVVMTSSPSPSPMPSARSARYIAAVQEETASATGASGLIPNSLS